ncbi:hypothetical protein MLM_1127 [Mycobacterium lepraemurium]|nr:hypothetical protein [Mycobacterium lepraemurium]ATA27899.1 hypothetical protein MLM_1127 [Mycobacterium lepraemurium]
MGMLFGLAPWIVHWVLVGNVPFVAAVLVALALAAVSLGLGGVLRRRWQLFDFASVAVLLVLAVLAFTPSESILQRWILPLSNAGICLVALAGMLIGKPFVAEFAAAEQAPDVAKTELFGRIVKILGWIWVATFAGLTVSSAIPSVLQGSAGAAPAYMLDTKTPLSFLCYWIIPFALLGLAAVVSRLLPDRMLIGIDDLERETSFVAYDEATIDELYFLAQEHANREVGPGKEAYAVKVGGMGTPLTGDESRKSWPSTYKVRDKRR